MNYRILHIADPHFTQCHCQAAPPSEIGTWHARELKTQLQKWGLLKDKIDAIVLSGDFTHQYRLDGFDAAEAFIEGIAEISHPGRFLIVPGNHDVNIGTPFRVGTLSIPMPREIAELHYRNFLNRVANHIAAPNRWLSMVQHLAKNSLPGLLLVGLNSCRIERSDAQGWGYVGQDQLRDLIDGLINGDVKARNGDIVIVVTHHHLLPVWDLGISVMLRTPEQRSYSFMIDAPSALDVLADLGTSLLLHGHAHVSSTKHVKGYGRDVATHDEMLVLGCGSLGFYPWSPHHIQLLEIGPDDIRSHDLTCLAHLRNHERNWTHERRLIGKLQKKRWQRTRAERALKDFKQECELHQIEFENLESWALLRGWPQYRDDLLQDMQKLDPTFTRQRLETCITNLISGPPDPAIGDGRFLQEYLLGKC